MSISYVASRNGNGNGTVTINHPAVAVGDLLMFIGTAPYAGNAPPVGASGQFTPTVSDNVNTGAWNVSVYYNAATGVEMIAAWIRCDTAGSPTVTVSLAGGTVFMVGYTTQYRGFAVGPNALASDVTTNFGDSGTFATTALTNGVPNELSVFAFGFSNGYNLSTYSGGFTFRAGTSGDGGCAFGDIVEATAGNSLSATGTITGSSNWGALVVSFSDGTPVVSAGRNVSSGQASMLTAIALESRGSAKSTGAGDPWLVLKGTSSGVLTSTADLATSIPFDSGGRAVGAARGALTSWASVVLASPLYTGRGSIVGPHCYWSNGAPAAGDTVYYDPTNMAVLADGEIVATATDFKAEVLWMPAAGQQSLLALQVSSGFVNWSQNVSTGGANLASEISFTSRSQRVSTGHAVLGVAASLRSSGRSVSTAVSGIHTAITLESRGASRRTGNSPFTSAITFSGHASARSSGVSSFSTGISLSSGGRAVSLTSATMFSGIGLRSRGMSVSTGAALQRQRVEFTSVGRRVSVGRASLLTAIPITSRGQAVSSSRGSVQFGVAFTSRGTSRSTGTSSLTSGIALVSRSGRLSSGILIQLQPSRFGWAKVTALSQTGAQSVQSAYIEQSTCYIEAAYFDDNDNPFVPSVVRYRVDDVASGLNIVPMTSIQPAETNLITITAAQNAMINATRNSESHQVLLQITDGFGNVSYERVVYSVIRVPGLT